VVGRRKEIIVGVVWEKEWSWYRSFSLIIAVG
jgi:hypothetical protein